MRRASIVKTILLVFFLFFFSFLFWYFYNPSEKQKTEKGVFEDFFSLFPFGEDKNVNDIVGTKKENKEKDNEEGYVLIPKLRQIANTPVSALYLGEINGNEIKKINKNRTKNNKISENDIISEIRYIDSKTGHIYRTFTDTLKSERISNTTIPKIYEVYFFDKDNFIIRYLNNQNKIKTYSVILSDKSFEEGNILGEEKKVKEENAKLKQFKGVFFPDGILSLAISPDKKSVAYLKESEKDSVLYSSGRLAENKILLYKSPLKELSIKWPEKNNIVFSTLPSKLTHSLFFKFNLQNTDFEKVGQVVTAGDIKVNSDMSKFIISGRLAGGKEFSLYLGEKNKSGLKNLGIKTFAEKCVWSKKNSSVLYCAVPRIFYEDENQPDFWYKGYGNFIDNIYKIDTESEKKELIFNYNDYSKKFDIINLSLDKNERNLYFIDKKTSFPWVYRIVEDRKKDIKKQDLGVKVDSLDLEKENIKNMEKKSDGEEKNQ